MAVCLVTGGAGFLGSHLVEALVGERHVVRVLDNFSTGKLENLASVMDAIELYPGDYFDGGFLNKAVRGVEWLFHLADGVGEGGGNRAVNGMLRILFAAHEWRVRRVLFASSVRVYGNAAATVSETDLAQPGCGYGQAKLGSEQACVTYTRISGVETVRLRYFNLFGPRQHPASPYSGVVRDALTALLAGRAPVLEGDEQTLQDLLYVQDAVHATLLAARAARVAGKVYNIGRGCPTSSAEVVAALNELLGSNRKAIYTGRPGVAHVATVADIRRAEMELGFCAATDLCAGLSRCLQANPAFRAARRNAALDASRTGRRRRVRSANRDAQ